MVQARVSHIDTAARQLSCEDGNRIDYDLLSLDVGSSPRILPGVLSPRRNNVDLSVAKNVRTGASTSVSVRLEVLNLFNIVQWAAPASAAFNNSSFGQITSQANNARMAQFTVRVGF